MPKATSAELAASFSPWWADNQPEWRITSKEGIFVQEGSGSVSELLVWGPVGVIEFMMLLFWWGSSIGSGKAKATKRAREEWHQALKDVTWILEL